MRYLTAKCQPFNQDKKTPAPGTDVLNTVIITVAFKLLLPLLLQALRFHLPEPDLNLDHVHLHHGRPTQ